MAVAAPPFAGFTPAAIQFMADLAQNNDRAWFQPRKTDYERLVKEPMEAMITELTVHLSERDIPLRADPRRSPFRIYRDTRFSRDKSPYKTHIGASFPWVDQLDEAGESVDEESHGNGGYFNFQPGEMYVGGGMWMAAKPRLDALRRAVLEEPDRVRSAIEEPGFVAWFGEVRSHEELKRTPPGYPPDHPMAHMFRWKDLVFGRRLADEEVCSPDLPRRLAEGYEAALPVFRFLATLR
jgi:uncharacterized protein (TIGR02453 family)